MPAHETKLIVATIVAPLAAATVFGVALSIPFFMAAPFAGTITASGIVGAIALFGLVACWASGYRPTRCCCARAIEAS